MDNLERFKTIPFQTRVRCVICEAPLPEPVISLPKFPLTEIYIDQEPNTQLGCIDQGFCYCENCGLGQLSNVVEPEFVYQGSYETRTSTSSSATAAIDRFMQFIDEVLKDRPIKSVVEIGCNDLYMLQQFKTRTNRLFGIDPIWVGRESSCHDDKIQTIGGFAEQVNFSNHGIDLDVVLCSHTLEHVSEPKAIIEKLIRHAGNDSLFFFQFPGLESLIQDSRFDQVFHQHLNYFSLKSVKYLLKELGCELIASSIDPYHWGSLMIAFRKKKGKERNLGETGTALEVPINEKSILAQYQTFKDGMSVTSRRISSLHHERIYGYGAALMLPVLDYHLEDGLTSLIGIIDEDPKKQGKYYLNLPLRVLDSRVVEDFSKSVFVLTAINSMDAGRKIIPKLFKMNVKQLIVPINTI